MARTRERYTAIHDLLAQGQSLAGICRTLGLDRSTVQRFARATTVDELLVKATSRTSRLDAFKPYLDQRLADGCTDATQLHHEIIDRGWRGSIQTVRRYIHPFRTLHPQPHKRKPATTPTPKPRRVVRWIMTDPDQLDADERTQLTPILGRCPELDAVARHVREFAVMLTQLRGDRLGDWINRVQADNLPHLHSFTAGLQRDQAAVTAGLTLPYNSGAVEGNVNRIKMIKRHMYGRANLDLLRARVLART